MDAGLNWWCRRGTNARVGDLESDSDDGSSNLNGDRLFKGSAWRSGTMTGVCGSMCVGE